MTDIPDDSAWWRTILKRIVRATRNDAQAEDYLHAAFIRLQEYRVDNEVRQPSAFLVRTALNLAVDEHRSQKVRNVASRQLADVFNISDANPLQSEALIARERLRRVREGLDRLSPRTREIFLMHRIEGLKYREIANRLGITVSAVEKHVAKGAHFLVEWVEGW
jgi:RNA polymerase sigma-70 factor (ECF subfamily)